MYESDTYESDVYDSGVNDMMFMTVYACHESDMLYMRVTCMI